MKAKAKIIDDNNGQWSHPESITRINSPFITMKNVDYPVLGISDTGQQQVMMPEQDYKFQGNTVTEIPLTKKGMKNLQEVQGQDSLLQKFLAIAGVKSEKEFQKKFPTEESFFKAHPEALELVQGQAPEDEVMPVAQNGINRFSGYAGNPNDWQNLGGNWGNAQPYIAGPNDYVGAGGNINSFYNNNGVNQPVPQKRQFAFPPLPTDMPTDINEANYPELYKGQNPNARNLANRDTDFKQIIGDNSVDNPTGAPVKAPLGDRINNGFKKAMPYIQAAGQVVSGIKALGAEKKQIKGLKNGLAASNANLSSSRFKDVDRYNREWLRPDDQVIDENELYPVYGTGTNILAENGYTIPQAQFGNTTSGAGQIGTGAGTAIGSIFGPLGGAIGGLAGGLIGSAFDKNGKKIKKLENQIQGNMEALAMNNNIEQMQFQNSAYMENGGAVPLGDGGVMPLETHWGGNTVPTSDNPYSEGQAVRFIGNQHSESDGKGNSGIGIKYGGSPIEVEGGEPAEEFTQPDGNKALTVFGDIKINEQYAEMMGDKSAKNKMFKSYINDIHKQETSVQKKQESLFEKMQAFKPESTQDKLKQNSLLLKIQGNDMKLKDFASKKENANAVQQYIHDMAEEQGISPAKLKKGGIVWPEAQKGKNGLGAPVDITPGGRNRNLVEKGTDKYGHKIYGTRSFIGGEKSPEGLGMYVALGPDGKYYNLTEENYLGTKGNESLSGYRDNFDKLIEKEPAKAAKLVRDYAVENNSSRWNTISKNTTDDAELLKQFKKYATTTPGETWDIYKYANRTPAPAVATPKGSEKKPVETGKYETKENKHQYWMDAANAVIPFFRPSNARGLDPKQLYGEMNALGTNHVVPVQAQQLQANLITPYDISLQDQLNENTSDYRDAERQSRYSPEAMAYLASKKYDANSKVLGDQFRQNQAKKDQVYNYNINKLDALDQSNAGILDTQYQRQNQALSNTKAVTQAALNSMSDKYLQQQRDNNELRIKENMYNFRYDATGRAINLNPLQQFDVPNYELNKNEPYIVTNDANGKPVRTVNPGYNGTYFQDLEAQRVADTEALKKAQDDAATAKGTEIVSADVTPTSQKTINKEFQGLGNFQKHGGITSIPRSYKMI